MHHLFASTLVAEHRGPVNRRRKEEVGWPAPAGAEGPALADALDGIREVDAGDLTESRRRSATQVLGTPHQLPG